MMEALACHPLGELPFRNIVIQHTDEPKDTIKVRMQLSRRGRAPGVSSRAVLPVPPPDKSADQKKGFHRHRP